MAANCKVPPLKVIVPELPMALACPNTKVPPLKSVPPVYELLPLKVMELPTPLLINWPVPEMGPDMVVDPVEAKLIVPLLTMVAVLSKEPDAPTPTTKVLPELMVVVPVKVLAPPRVTVALPSTTNAPPNEIRPERVCAADEAYFKVPLLSIAPA